MAEKKHLVVPRRKRDCSRVWWEEDFPQYLRFNPKENKPIIMCSFWLCFFFEEKILNLYGWCQGNCICSDITKWFADFFFFFFVFCWAAPKTWGGSQGRGPISCSLQPIPQPQQCGIWAESATYTIPHGKARCLTHWGQGSNLQPQGS